MRASAAGERRWRGLSQIWVLLVLALIVQQVQFWRAPQLDTDVMALLPGEAQDPLLALASEQIAASATRQLVSLVGADDWARARAAAERYVAVIDAADSDLRRVQLQPEALQQALNFYRGSRAALLTSEQRVALAGGDPQARVAEAMARLYAPGPNPGLLSWREDPLDLWASWWQSRRGSLGLREGWIHLSDGDRVWIVVRMVYQQSAFRFDGSRALGEQLEQAAAAARVDQGEGAIEILNGGVPLHAEAAAARASWEVNTIGLGSLAAVVLLVWLSFRRLQPLLLVASSLLIGVAAGAAVTALVFGQLHLLTLVFGASLVGVAEDYGIHYYASRQQSPEQRPLGLMRALLPGLGLALITSVLAYLALGLAPFPGLRQMAVFSAAGLSAAFLTVVLWFPWLDGPAPKPSGFARAIADSLQRWPRIAGKPGWLTMGLIGTLIVGGLAQLKVDDSLRSLQSSPPELIASEGRIARLLGLPSPAQFYLIQAGDPQALLQAEEALTRALQPLIAEGELAGLRAISQWLPSLRQQQADGELTRSVEGPLLAAVGAQLGENLQPDPAPLPPLLPDDWLKLAIAEPMRAQWLGSHDGAWGSVVMLEGLTRESDLGKLAALAGALPEVRWVDRSASISALLGHYRAMMLGLLLVGFVAVAIALQLRLGRSAWRALLPTVLAALLSVALLGWVGEPLRLFSVLAQLLLLGIGVDYGIFLFEHRQDPASWLAINVGAASTLLAFGLLSLSATPALHSFGLCLLFGIALVWVLSPCFRPPPAADPHA